METSNLRYFSSLTSKQKDKSILALRLMRNDLHALPKELGLSILNHCFNDWGIVFNKLKGAKMFIKDGVFYPLNFKDIIIKTTKP